MSGGWPIKPSSGLSRSVAALYWKSKIILKQNLLNWL